MTMFSKTFHLVRSVLLWACVALFAASACDAHMTIGENTLPQTLLPLFAFENRNDARPAITFNKSHSITISYNSSSE